MVRQTFSIYFFIKKSRLLKNGEAPIYVRITVNGSSVEFGIKRSIEIEHWKVKKGYSDAKTDKGREINNHIEHIRYKIYEIQRKLKDENKPVTSNAIKDIFFGKNKVSKTLLEAFRYHNDRFHQLVGKEISAGTYQIFQTTYKHVSEFVKFNYNTNDISLNGIDYRFIKDFEFYLKVEKQIGHNTTVKYIKNLGKILRISVSNDWMKENPLEKMSYTQKPVDKAYLTGDELRILLDKDFGIDRLNKVKDIYIVCCFTGLAFSDIKNLKKEHIVNGLDNKKWIIKKREKTNVLCNIPLLPVAERILDKYKDFANINSEGLLLPVNSNQKMNAYLKEIADLCGINKELSTHTARHTFATTVTLANKVSMEAVSKMLGHTDLKMTRLYARIVDSLVSDEMDKVVNLY